MNADRKDAGYQILDVCFELQRSAIFVARCTCLEFQAAAQRNITQILSTNPSAADMNFHEFFCPSALRFRLSFFFFAITP
ncbi:MAG: hypothetical protein PHR06_16685 [Candidatus Cloacimonetes bacterium]|nr:hypothetical protein [Candidatus Cloacimonadota bacterium]